MPVTVTKISRRWIDGDCYEIRHITQPDGSVVVKKSPEPESFCTDAGVMKPSAAKAPAPSSGRPAWLIPVAIAGAGAIGLWLVLRQRT